jgi:dolichyl-phosphate beta-glucosyltransferase
MKSLSIVIPVYNEEKRIEKTLNKILEYIKIKKIKYEIIIVDDFSKDKTIDVIKKFKEKIIILKNNKNYGKGYSIKKGIENAKNELILFSDADLATPIEELDKMLGFINKFDIIIASRNLKESKIVIKQPFYRQLLGKTFPLLVRLLLISDIKDTQCGFKLFKNDIAKNIVKLQTINRFCFDVELLFIAKKLGYKIKEIPVIWID